MAIARNGGSSRFKSYFWCLICVISTALCVILIHSQFKSFNSDRIATTIASTSYPIWQVPFPAVTLCNFNMVYRANMEGLKDMVSPWIPEENIESFFSNLSSLLSLMKPEIKIDFDEFAKITTILDNYGYDTELLMKTIMQPCEKLLSTCSWNGNAVNCSEIFKITKTNIGFCCAFNYEGIKLDPDNDPNDLFVTGVGPTFGLSVHLNIEESQYVSAYKNNLGVDVSIHESGEYPDMTIYTTTVRPGNEVALSVKPEITESHLSVKNIDIGTRKCAFDDEIKMEWAPIYTYNTCINECKAKAILELCNCVPYYYPLKARFCTLPDMECIRRINIKGDELYTFIKEYSKKASGDTTSCNCYPQCNKISYSYQLDLQSIKMSDTPTNDSILRVYFGHVSCTKLLRNVFITWELILASVGGLIGLCLGGSILSIIELLYYIVETIFAKYRKQPPARIYLRDFGAARPSFFAK